jgi:hypothetical protein
VKRTDPEPCLSLTPDVTDVPVQLDRPLEQDQLVGDVRVKLQPSRRRIQQPSVQDPAARQSQIGRDRAQVSLGLSESAGVTTKDRFGRTGPGRLMDMAASLNPLLLDRDGIAIRPSPVTPGATIPARRNRCARRRVLVTVSE